VLGVTSTTDGLLDVTSGVPRLVNEPLNQVCASMMTVVVSPGIIVMSGEET
jgi:hypothetical protein